MNINSVLDRVSIETGIQKEIIQRTYNCYWKFIRYTIQQQQLKDAVIEDEDDFHNLRLSFNIPSLGKLACTWNKYNRQKRDYDYLTAKNEL